MTDLDKIKTYTKSREVTPEEAMRLLADVWPNPIPATLHYGGSGQEADEGLLLSVGNNTDRPFLGSNRMAYSSCWIKETLHPRASPHPLPDDKPWLAYVGVGPLKEQSEERPYWSFSCDDFWYKQYSGDCKYHYAIDVRTEFAKEHYPEIVECYKDCSFMQPQGGTVFTDSEGRKFRITITPIQ